MMGAALPAAPAFAAVPAPPPTACSGDSLLEQAATCSNAAITALPINQSAIALPDD